MSTTRVIKPITPEIELFGDWDKTRALLKTIDASIATGVRAGQRAAAERLKAIVRKNIRENGGSIGWAPVSKSYAKRKASLGYDPTNLLYMTGTYYRNITIWDRGTRFYVGLPSRMRHPIGKSPLTLIQIATILEYGTHAQDIPARPLWRPSYRQMGGGARIRSLIVWHVRDRIRKDHGITAKVTL